MSSVVSRVQQLGFVKDEYVVIGSGLLDALGLRVSGDLDLAVSDELFARLSATGHYEQRQKNGTTFLVGTTELTAGLEIWRDWKQDLPFSELRTRTVEVDGVVFAHPSVIIERKSERGLAKDLTDIQLLTEYYARIPKHIGYIVDGNRRWAKQHGLPTYEGHLAGYTALKEVALATLASGVQYMSAYVFSTENWNRSADEVKKLMGLTLRILKSDIPIFNKNNVRLKVIGSLQGVDPKIVKSIHEAEKATETNNGGTFLLCFNYGGQLELVDAMKNIVRAGIAADDITQETIAQNLYAPEVPPADLIVRTSGEMRLSNFMLWRAAYSELIFLDKSWPDMTKSDVTAIINEYANRHRRFGK